MVSSQVGEPQPVPIYSPHLFCPHLFPVDGYMDKAEDFERGVGEYI